MRTYSKPPLTEAIIEIRTNADVDADRINRIIEKFKTNYPNISVLRDLGFEVDVSGGSAILRDEKKRFRLTSEDEADILIIQDSTLTSARLSPYVGWDKFFDSAMNNYKNWKMIAKPKKINRLGVRFINRIDIPMNKEKLVRAEEYFNFYIEVPEGAFTPIGAFNIQTISETNFDNWLAKITSAKLTPGPIPGFISIMLDIDVFQKLNVNPNIKIVRDIIHSARIVKNTIFEQCITDRTRDLFK